MVFEFRNLGIIESADIELKGLTIITGLNDTGKSFLSKTIFSIIKTLYGAKEQAINERYEKISGLVTQIFSLHRQMIAFSPEKLQTFNPNELSNRIYVALLNNTPESEMRSIVNSYKDRVIFDIETNIVNPSLTPQKIVYINRIKEISQIIVTSLKDDLIDDEGKFKNFFDNIIIQKLFQGQLNSINGKKSTLNIKVKEGESELLEISVQDNKSILFKLESVFLLNDATIIDSPIIVQLAKFITNTLAFPTNFRKIYQPRLDLPYPYYDLIEKMNVAGSVTPQYSEVFQEIKKIIKGELQYRLEDGTFEYKKETGAIIKAFNIATGIKSFGVIQILLSSGAINQKTVLIIDEPEVHLHPSWETQYARIIVLLSKLNIPIIVSSHSPYFLQAITKYIKEFQTEKLTKVYFGEKIANKNTTSFKDVTNDLEPIFKALSKPMQDVYLN
jgi:predicted ATP-dependent endonuclease of OLD family